MRNKNADIAHTDYDTTTVYEGRTRAANGWFFGGHRNFDFHSLLKRLTSFKTYRVTSLLEEICLNVQSAFIGTSIQKLTKRRRRYCIGWTHTNTSQSCFQYKPATIMTWTVRIGLLKWYFHTYNKYSAMTSLVSILQYKVQYHKICHQLKGNHTNSNCLNITMCLVKSIYIPLVWNVSLSIHTEYCILPVFDIPPHSLTPWLKLLLSALEAWETFWESWVNHVASQDQLVTANQIQHYPTDKGRGRFLGKKDDQISRS